jgi:hypothetical protein
MAYALLFLTFRDRKIARAILWAFLTVRLLVFAT